MTPKRRTAFKLREFQGIAPEVVAKLAAYGIKSAEQMLIAGATQPQRAALAAAARVPEAIILELVKLSDLARLPGVKGEILNWPGFQPPETLPQAAGWS